MKKLRKHGASHILVPSMPDLSLTPRVQAIDKIFPGTIEMMAGLTVVFNQTLTQELANNPDLQSVSHKLIYQPLLK